MKRLKLTTCISIISMLLMVSATRVVAVDISIEANGSNSQSEAVVDQAVQTTITQTQAAQSDTEVKITADTGNNQASGNTGEEVGIETGDIEVELNTQTDINQSHVELDQCCQEDDQITISQNGSNSQNTVDSSNTNQTDITIQQTAQVTNNSAINANTGKNTANNNNADVSIKTGDITSNKSFKTSTNHAQIELGCCHDVGATIKIKNNGSGTQNHITSNQENSKNINIYQRAKIDNQHHEDLNTGDNHADDNNGDVSIDTGDIDSETSIDNDINNGDVVIKPPSSNNDDNQDNQDDDDQDNDDDTDDTAPSNPPSTPPSTSVGGGTSNGGSGSNNSDSSNGSTASHKDIAGQVLGIGGAILPATGSNALFHFLIANMLTFVFGCYLRLRAGRSPAKAYAFA